jgi:hypothetical protein
MKIKEASPGYFMMYCPGCENLHAFGESWGFNKDFDDKPDVQGSLLTHPTRVRNITCHLFIRHGKIQYLTDSTHSLAGTTIDLPEIPKSRYIFHDEEEEE